MRIFIDLDTIIRAKRNTQHTTTMASKMFQYPPSRKRLIPRSLTLQMKSTKMMMFRRLSTKMKKGSYPTLKPAMMVERTKIIETPISDM